MVIFSDDIKINIKFNLKIKNPEKHERNEKKSKFSLPNF